MLKEMKKAKKSRKIRLLKGCSMIFSFCLGFYIAYLTTNLTSTNTGIDGWVEYVKEHKYWPTSLFSVSVKGDSMNPTLMDGDSYVTDKTNRAKKSIQRGDILSLSVQNYVDDKTETGPGDLNILKRVIGIGGDTINIDVDGICVNGERLNEDYVSEMEWKEELFIRVIANSPSLFDGTSVEFQVPEGHVFVLGDNRAVSLDSRVLPYRFLNVETQVLGRIIR